MSTGARILVGVVASMVLAVGFLVAVAATTVARAGTIDIDVQAEDGGVSIQAPAGLADLLLLFVPDGALSDLARLDDDPDLRDARRHVPAIREAWQSLVDAPDFTAVEVVQRDGRVRVEKRGAALVVHVEDDGSSFDMTLPLATVSRALRKL